MSSIDFSDKAPRFDKIKGETFRLSNMGDETEETISHLLSCLDDCLGGAAATAS